VSYTWAKWASTPLLRGNAAAGRFDRNSLTCSCATVIVFPYPSSEATIRETRARTQSFPAVVIASDEY